MTASARDHEEGTDRSSEQALEETLQSAMGELVAEIIKALR